MKAHSLPRKRTALIVATAAFIIAIVSSSFFYLNSPKLYAGETENVSFGTFLGSSEQYPELVYVAQDKHFFAQNGINLTITDHTSATGALNAALNNKVDMAISSEYAFVVTNVLNHGNLNIIATIDKSQSVSIVGRKDRGIESIPNLAGKKIGLTLQIAPQFYLARFLELNSVNTQNITLVNLATTEYVKAIINGTVDAVVISDSSIPPIENQLPNDTVAWSVQSIQLTNMVVSCRSDWIAQHPKLVTRFLNSLAQAETYLVNHVAEAESIVQKRVTTHAAETKAAWVSHQFSLSLDQSLILAMEDEVRWMISNHLTNQTEVPNFLTYLYLDGLMSVKPESVNIIH
jgi:NitT/TauT family transport system substrate-binding protein